MTRTHYSDPTGLSADNVSSANDLAKLVQPAAQYPTIREFSTTPAHYVEVSPAGHMLGFNNSNALVKNTAWDIQLQKTGYIREAGRCLVMLANIASRPLVIVLLDSNGKFTRLGDAQRIKHWVETGEALAPPPAAGGRHNGTFPPRAKAVAEDPQPHQARSRASRSRRAKLVRRQRAGRRLTDGVRQLLEDVLRDVVGAAFADGGGRVDQHGDGDAARRMAHHGRPEARARPRPVWPQ